MTFKFTLDNAGGAEVLKKMARSEVSAWGRQIAAKAGDAVEVDDYVTDRAATAVSIPAAIQAKHGLLSRAATASGLEVKLK